MRDPHRGGSASESVVVDSKRDAVASWPRPYFRQPGGAPFLFYVLYGKAAQPLRLSRSKYRCTGDQ